MEYVTEDASNSVQQWSRAVYVFCGMSCVTWKRRLPSGEWRVRTSSGAGGDRGSITVGHPRAGDSVHQGDRIGKRGQRDGRDQPAITVETQHARRLITDFAAPTSSNDLGLPDQLASSYSRPPHTRKRPCSPRSAWHALHSRVEMASTRRFGLAIASQAACGRVGFRREAGVVRTAGPLDPASGLNAPPHAPTAASS